MRIVAGEWKGRRIGSADATRPTADRVREALFSILGGALEGTFLDLFSGSGAVGLEARSRGATSVLVERDPAALAAIRANMEALDVTAGVTVIEMDVMRFLKVPASSLPRVPEGPAGWIFADPPYGFHLRDKLLRLLSESPYTGPQTSVIVERSKDDRTRVPDGLVLEREESYGATGLSFYRKGAEPVGAEPVGAEPVGG